MGERKVLNKYFPPDFDPAKLPRGTRTKDNFMKVRMMMAMTVQCQTCGTFIYKGTKFTMRKEDVLGETYLGIQIYRFYFRCKKCAAEITFKTDPKNSDYFVEHGAHRTAEPFRDQAKAVEEHKKQREDEEAGNAMKALENRTMDAKREMDIMADIEEARLMKSRQEKLGADAVLAAIRRGAQEDAAAELEDEEAELQRLLQQQAQYVKRLEDGEEEASTDDSDEEGEGGERGGGGGAGPGPSRPAAAAPAAKPGPSAAPKPAFVVQPRVVVKPKAAPGGGDGPAAKKQKTEGGAAAAAAPAMGLGLGDYGSASSSDGE